MLLLCHVTEKSNVLVIEIGTHESRFGFAGDEHCQVVFPSNSVTYTKPTVRQGSTEIQTTTIIGESKPWKYVSCN